MHAYFASHGYAAVRLDRRGSGDSDGVLLDEYLAQEQDDAVEAIRWIAESQWPSPSVTTRRLFFAPGRLASSPGPD